MWTRPSLPTPISTNAPNGARLLIVPSTLSPARIVASFSRSTSGLRGPRRSRWGLGRLGSRIVRLIRRASASTLLTQTVTGSPICTSSVGDSTRVSLISEIWTKPSRPTPTSTKTPYSAMLVTLPSSCMPGCTSLKRRGLPPLAALSVGSKLAAASAGASAACPVASVCCAWGAGCWVVADCCA